MLNINMQAAAHLLPLAALHTSPAHPLHTSSNAAAPKLPATYSASAGHCQLPPTALRASIWPQLQTTQPDPHLHSESGTS